MGALTEPGSRPGSPTSLLPAFSLGYGHFLPVVRPWWSAPPLTIPAAAAAASVRDKAEASYIPFFSFATYTVSCLPPPPLSSLLFPSPTLAPGSFSWSSELLDSYIKVYIRYSTVKPVVSIKPSSKLEAKTGALLYLLLFFSSYSSSSSSSPPPLPPLLFFSSSPSSYFIFFSLLFSSSLLFSPYYLLTFVLVPQFPF